MRESNFAFPAQNRACVCITSQLYDRRALDTTSALPLFNSLTHLTYLTSTSPRIREIMTMDGGLERLVRILHEFCICPPPPENPAILYGLSPPNARLPKQVPTLIPQSYDKHAAVRFSLAFQCVVNIGVRGSEPIRSRVVQAGTLDVVGCILEAWLANKGFAVGPSSSATGMPRESRQQRQARRLAQQEQRQREEVTALARALEQHLSGADDESMDISPNPGRSVLLATSSAISLPGPSSDTDVDTSTDTSTTTTPLGTNTPTGTVLVPGRNRSGTVIGRAVWDEPLPIETTATRHRHRQHRQPLAASPSPSTNTSRPETETEDDGDNYGDVDVDMDGADRSQLVDHDFSESPEPHHHQLSRRRAVAIVTDSDGAAAAPLQVNTDAHIIINDAQGDVVGGDGGVGVEDGIVSLEPNDDFAMGAPPGAPGAIDENVTPLTVGLNDRRRPIAPDVTPRAGMVNLPMVAGVAMPDARQGHQRNGTLRGRPVIGDAAVTPGTGTIVNTTATAARSINAGGRTASHHHRDTESGPYRDEDVLLSLQLLAYLSKYPHVRQAFYKPRVSFHPASVNLPGARYGVGSNTSGSKTTVSSPSGSAGSSSTSTPAKESLGFFRAFTSGRGKEKEKVPSYPGLPSLTSLPSTTQSCASLCATNGGGEPRRTNVFSLVERFTFRPSATETDLPNPPPKLPPEIQYWAGVIMRNACRKDESRGGIRQCANMLCGRWESYPREFAKCRRCRKAKYCGKECQSTAWSEGHRFWCSAKDADEEATGEHHHHHVHGHGQQVPIHGRQTEEPVLVEVVGVDDGGAGIGAGAGAGMTAGGTITGRRERVADRERERRDRERTPTTTVVGFNPGATPYRGIRSVQQSVVSPAIESRPRLGEGNLTLRDPVIPPQAPSRVVIPEALLRNQGISANELPNSGYDAHVLGQTGLGLQDQGGRRRAETVTGLTLAPSPHGHHRPRTQPAVDRYYAQAVAAHIVGGSIGIGGDGSGESIEAGPSRLRRVDDGNGIHSPSGDQDMILG